MKYTRGPWNATGSPQVWANDGSKVAHASNHENARLISAAPEMYEALKNMLDDKRDFAQITKDIESARKAVAKAEGR